VPGRRNVTSSKVTGGPDWILLRLSSGTAPVTQLAAPFDMALPSFLRHLRVLENCGLVRSRKSGRVRTYQISPEPLKAAEGWMKQQGALWERRLDQLDRYVEELGPTVGPTPSPTSFWRGSSTCHQSSSGWPGRSQST